MQAAGKGAAMAENARVARMVKKANFILASGKYVGLGGLFLGGLENVSDIGVSC